MTKKYQGLWLRWTLYTWWSRLIGCPLCFGCWMAHRDQDRDMQMGDYQRCEEGDHWKPTFRGAVDRHRLGTFDY